MSENHGLMDMHSAGSTTPPLVFTHALPEPTTSWSSKRQTPGNPTQQLLREIKASPSGWKPFTTKAPVLGAIIIATLGPAVTIEVLAQRSQSQGGLALSDSAEQVPALTMIAYHHLPTTIAVIYSLAWTWIDLDVLMPIDQQATAMDISILNAAYGATWLDQDAPEYTTSDFAILPFTISDQRTTASCQSSAANAVLSAHLHPAPQSQRPFRVNP